MTAFYNEFDPAAAHVLECLIKDKVIADGVVDRRSIADINPEDLAEFTQVHLFAGGGLWSVAARMAGWPDDRQLWTGSCPCQPFSVAGKGLGEDDPRHLWPHMFRLVRALRPPVVVGEQVSGKAGFSWFDGVAADLEGEDYACRALDIPACAVNAPHIRQRLYWCAVANASDYGTGRFARTPDDQRRQAMDAGSARIRPGDGARLSGGTDARNSGDEDVDNAASARRGAAGREPLGASWDEARRARSERRGGDGFDMAAADEPRLERRRPAAERAAQQPVGPDGVAGDVEHAHRARQQYGGEMHSRLGVDGARAADYRAAGRAGGSDGDMADAELPERRQIAKGWPHDDHGSNTRRQEASGGREFHRAANGGFWGDYVWLTGADGKARRVGRAQPAVRGLVDGLPAGIHGELQPGSRDIQETIPLLTQGYVNRVAALRIMGNAIVPQLAAQVLRALMETIEIPR